MVKRNRRAGVEDRWNKSVRDESGNARTVPSARHGKGMRWLARYVDDRGREHTKAFGRKSDAQQWLDKETADHVVGTWTDPKLSGQTFGALAERWIQTKATRAPKTVAGYRSLLDTLVLPRWADVALRDMSFDDIQEWVSGLSVSGSVRFRGTGLGAGRVIQAYQVIKQVLQFAVRAKHLPANPADGVELPRKPEAAQRYLTHEQLHRLAVASGRFRSLVLVLGYCGLRFGEAAALRVADVNCETRRIQVSRSVTYVTYTGLVEGSTKNHSARSVPVAKFLAPLLATELAGKDRDTLVFPSRHGGYLSESELRWVFDPAANAVGVEGLTPHQLRHTCASLAISAGANVKVLQTLLGHKTATLTLDRYGHLFPDDLGRIADAFDAAAENAADWVRTGPSLRAVPSDGDAL
jgi:integrase